MHEPSSKRAEYLWKTALEDLRSEYPPEYPVWVQRRVLRDHWGLCSFNSETERFSIAVAPHPSFNFMLEVLIHEWAHMLDWFSTQEPGTDHGDTWGIWYARAYRAVMGQ